VLRMREDVHRRLRLGRGKHRSRNLISVVTERPCFDSSSLHPQGRPKIEMAVDREDITSAGEDSSTDDDNASQTTEDDPQVPQTQSHTGEHPNRPPPPPPTTTLRDGPRYELTHTMSGHTQSISAVKFSPDGTLLASCCVCILLTPKMRKIYGAFGFCKLVC
jgi:WD40 repeat protein